MNQSTHNKVYNKVVKHKRGIVMFPSDFCELGSVDAVKMSLSRLEKEKVLERLAQGIYLYPKQHPTYGNLYPSTEEIAVQIARRDHAKIVPTGSAALHKLRLTTQIPTNMVCLTDGAPRKIKVGKQRITFKAAVAKKLATKGEISTLVIQALQELGQKGVDDKIKEHLRAILATEDPRILKHDVKFAPAWVAKLMKELAALRND
jgi:predicted transcriptional regulator of viral defense system